MTCICQTRWQSASEYKEPASHYRWPPCRRLLNQELALSDVLYHRLLEVGHADGGSVSACRQCGDGKRSVICGDRRGLRAGSVIPGRNRRPRDNPAGLVDDRPGKR